MQYYWWFYTLRIVQVDFYMLRPTNPHQFSIHVTAIEMSVIFMYYLFTV